MNLLPNTEKESLRKSLKLRSLAVMMFLLSASFLIGLVLLLPAYFLAVGNFSEVSSRDLLSGIENKDNVDVEEILSLPAEINAKLNLLQSNNDQISALEPFSEVVALLPSGVKLDSLAFNRNQASGNQTTTLIIASGIAEDRDSLVAFSSLLEKSELFSEAEIPVSSLTRNKDIPFSIRIFIEDEI